LLEPVLERELLTTKAYSSLDLIRLNMVSVTETLHGINIWLQNKAVINIGDATTNFYIISKKKKTAMFNVTI
jgi:hypothetical protein